MSKLNLDRDKIKNCRDVAGKIAQKTYNQVSGWTTTAIERASLRLLGLDEAFEGKPVADLIFEAIPDEEKGRGACYWFGRALATGRSSPIALALRIASGKLDLAELPEATEEDISKALEPLITKAIERLKASARHKKEQESKYASFARPIKYVAIGTGDITQDAEQALSAAHAGADCIELRRPSGQSLTESVPQGESHEPSKGTAINQANLRYLRRHLDEQTEKLGRYIKLSASASGLCMPEIAVIASFEKIDYLLSDALYGILFRDIDAHRAYCDQHFSQLVLALSGVMIHTGEGPMLAQGDAYRIFPQALASHFMSERFCELGHMQDWQTAFTHAFQIDPAMEEGLLYEIAQAQMVRECFPKASIKYKPPTRHKSGDIYTSHLMDGLFMMTGAMTHQDIQEIGSASEAVQNPLVMDRHWSLKAANYVLKNARSLGDEIQWSLNGKIVRRARAVLDGAYRFLQKIDRAGGLFRAISKGAFSGITREPERGLGRSGLIEKSDNYYNPVWESLLSEQPEGLSMTPASQRRFNRSSNRDGERRERGRGGSSRSSRRSRSSSRQGRGRSSSNNRRGNTRSNSNSGKKRSNTTKQSSRSDRKRGES